MALSRFQLIAVVLIGLGFIASAAPWYRRVLSSAPGRPNAFLHVSAGGTVPFPLPSSCPSSPNYGCYGRYFCDPPATLWQSALNFMTTVIPRPNFIIMTGDLAAHGMKTGDLVLGAIATATTMLQNTYPNTPIVVTTGNNDYFPRYSVGVPIQNWLQKLLTVWGPLMPNDDARAMFGRYGCYAHSVNANLTILSLNTIALSPSYAPYPPPDPSLQNFQFSWLEANLRSAALSGKKVYIIGHIPPGNGIFEYQILWHDAYTQTYYDIITQYEDVIEGEFFGHTHRDEFRVEVNTTTNRQASLLIAPSISPNTETNPSFRVVLYKSTNFEVVDYVQYYTDLLSQENGKLTWKVEYNFNEAYSLTSANTTSLYALFQKLRSDPQTFADWSARFTSLYSPNKLMFFCVINYPNREDFLKCLGQIPPEFTGPLPPNKRNKQSAGHY